MPKKTAPTPVNPAAVREEGQALIAPLASEAGLLIIRNEEDYLVADGLLSRIRRARKTWGDRMEAIIRPIRSGLDEIYSLNRDVDRPLEAQEARVKGLMRDYKLEEQRQIQAAKEEREREERRKLEEAETKRIAAEQAQTARMRERLIAQATRAEAQAAAVAQTPIPQAVRGESSVSRPVQKVRVHNLTHFLQGIVDGYIPEDLVTVNQVALNREFKAEPDGIKAWPGVEVFDDIQIVGR